ncbi:MAG TPA: sigma-70 family RNA polymerase sigma factor [Nannocystaceae bacterium]|nr:sigma-70 family RNA polymerase sigma factor [Nannocystaceae bacterium]
MEVDDLALARGALRGDVDAVATFEQRFAPELRRVIQRLGAGDELDDLLHVLLARLLVGTDDKPAKLASYRGDGSLHGWVRAVATRAVIDHLRGRRARAPVVPLVESGLVHSAALERGIEGQRFVDAVRSATIAAFDELTPRQRNLLRHATFHRLGIDELAVIYRVHRTTTARWLQRTRESLHAAIAAKLATATSIARDDAASVLREAAGAADVSLRSVLASAFEHEGDDARL